MYRETKLLIIIEKSLMIFLFKCVNILFMKSYIVGNIRKIIYQSNTGPYKVGIFKVRESNDEELTPFLNKIISFTGSFTEIDTDLDYVFYGKLVVHPKYGVQYQVENYEVKAPNDLDSLVLYLSSGMFKGIGAKTAKKIVERFGLDTINVIKNDYPSIATVSGMTITKARRMHDVIANSEYNQDLILKLNSYGFSVHEAINLITIYKSRIEDLLSNNIYELVEHVNFDKLDLMFLKNNDEMHPYRIEALLLHNIYTFCYESGDTLIKREELFLRMKKCFKNVFSADTYLSYIEKLKKEDRIIEIDDMIALKEFTDTEKYILNEINRISSLKNIVKDEKIDLYISDYEKRCNIKFNDDQKAAIKGSIKNNFFIISGGPGTGKTTIIKAIVEIIKDLYDLTSENFALLAPTGRASKRMAESVHAPAYTIHKFLKWNKETGSFLIDEYNKTYEDIIIIDESSMIDIFLFSSLLKGLKDTVKLILVGDANQLPSIGPGDILNDLLNRENLCNKYLNTIYRVKEGSYITYLASDIKNRKYFDKFSKEFTDFKFIESSDENIPEYLKKICNTIIDKKISINDFQVLAPMYKGFNGIDNLNNMMANIFNPNNEVYTIGDKNYRVNDKVIQLVNDIDNNIFNGDIGYIKDISYVDKKLTVTIDFMGNKVIYNQGEFDRFSLAYAISIHKAQGSEYDNVVIVLAKSFKRMFYNKLIYTAVTRAKKSLILIGDINSLNSSVQTMYAEKRNTYSKLTNN